MSPAPGGRRGICPPCARRQHLLGQLSRRLGHAQRDPDRQWAALALSDRDLAEMLGGEDESFCAGALPDTAFDRLSERTGGEAASFCRHHCAYPQRLREQTLSPPVLELSGAPERLRALLEHKLVAIVGTRGATAYGTTVAHLLARELAASGVTIAALDREPIGSAALQGALAAGSSDDERARRRVAALAVSYAGPPQSGELDRGGNPQLDLDLLLANGGCALSEPTTGNPCPSWRRLAALRTLVLLSDVLVAVEAHERSTTLACASLAGECGVPVAAVPGPIDSPGSHGCNALIAAGAPLAGDAAAVLGLLYGAGSRSSRAPRRVRRAPPAPASRPPRKPASGLDPALAGVLERVERGASTMAELCLGGGDCSGVALALTELELLGLLHRGEDGRYTGGGTPWTS